MGVHIQHEADAISIRDPDLTSSNKATGCQANTAVEPSLTVNVLQEIDRSVL